MFTSSSVDEMKYIYNQVSHTQRYKIRYCLIISIITEWLDDLINIISTKNYTDNELNELIMIGHLTIGNTFSGSTLLNVRI